MHYQIRSTVPSVLIVSFLLTGLRPADDVQDAPAANLVTEARNLAEALWHAAEIPGFSVAVGLGDRIVWTEGFGIADLESGVPATPQTRFRAASVSKVLTVAGVARLYAEGRLDLDAPASRYVPSFSGPAGVTPRRLAGHLSGIRHYREGDDTLGFRHFDSVSEALAAFVNDSLMAAPGARYHYSTFAYTLLAAVIERAAGEPYLDYLERSVFLPLQMRRTGPDVQAAILRGRSGYYVRQLDGLIRNAPFEDPSYKWAGGGFLTTAPDLVRFAIAHLQPGFLPADVLAEMFESQRTTDGEETGVGIGWRVGKDGGGRRIVHHAGSMNGARSVVMFWPELGVSVAMMSNLAATPAFIEQTAEIVAGPWLRRAEAQGEDLAPPSGRFEYEGDVNGDSVSGWIEIGVQEGTPDWMEAPARLTSIFRANGLPTSGRFEVPGTYVEKDTLHLVLATPFGLLPLEVQPDDAGGFTGEIRAGQVTFRLKARPVGVSSDDG